MKNKPTAFAVNKQNGENRTFCRPLYCVLIKWAWEKLKKNKYEKKLF